MKKNNKKTKKHEKKVKQARAIYVPQGCVLVMCSEAMSVEYSSIVVSGKLILEGRSSEEFLEVLKTLPGMSTDTVSSGIQLAMQADQYANLNARSVSPQSPEVNVAEVKTASQPLALGS